MFLSNMRRVRMASVCGLLLALLVTMALGPASAVPLSLAEDQLSCVGCMGGADEEQPMQDEAAFASGEDVPCEKGDERVEVAIGDEPGMPQSLDEVEATAEAQPQPEVEALTTSAGDSDGRVGMVAEPTLGAEASQTEVASADPEASVPRLTGRCYLTRHGWRSAKRQSDGIVMGTTGKGIGLDAFELGVEGGALSFRAKRVRAGSSVGWGSWASAKPVGLAGKGRCIEVVQIRPGRALGGAYDVVYRVHVHGIGWMGWARNGAYAGFSGSGRAIEAIEVRLVPKGEAMADVGVAYRDAGLGAQAHVQRLGWMAQRVGNTVTVGTTGRKLRLEALRIVRPELDLTGDVVVNAYVQGRGWQGRRDGGDTAGTTSAGRRVEAITVRLTEGLREGYDMWYRLYVQGVGWMGWAKNGERAGTTSLGLRVEAVQLALRRKGAREPAPSDQGLDVPFVDGSAVDVAYAAGTAERRLLWRSDGATSGTAKGAALTSLAVRSRSEATTVWCSVHVAGGGWTDYVCDGTWAGAGKARIDGVRMSLSGDASPLLSVWYRTYLRGVGWTLWARDGDVAGAMGRGTDVVAVQARVGARATHVADDSDAGVATTNVDASFPQLSKDANALQKRLLRSSKTTPWPGPGLCAGWVEDVYARAGLGTVVGNACDLYDRYCKSADPKALKAGMIVAVRTHTRSSAGSIWGHVGIYVGNGWVLHSVGTGVRKVQLSWWVSYYGTTYTPKWGWLGSRRVA